MIDDIILITTTVEKKADAERLASLLVDHRLVACAQIFAPMLSVYSWQGQTVTAEEFMVVLKTRKSLYPKVEQFLLKEHPYQTPEILAQDIASVSDTYLRWVMEETA